MCPYWTNSALSRRARPVLQRKCACGGTPGPTGECQQCKRKRLALQSKLTINQPGDRYEQEADHMADAVVKGIVPKEGSKRQREETPLQCKTPNESATASAAPSIVHDVLAESGQPLDAQSRPDMEARFGHDFGAVRIHADAKAAESARAVNAHGYTVGAHIAFGAGVSPQLLPRVAGCSPTSSPMSCSKRPAEKPAYNARTNRPPTSRRRNVRTSSFCWMTASAQR